VRDSGTVITPGPVVFDDFTFSKEAWADVTISGTLNVGGDLSLENNSTSSEVDGGAIDVQGNITLSSGSGGTTALRMSGSSIQTIKRTGGTWPTGKITVNKTGGTVELASNVTFGATQDMDLLAGTINMNGYNLGVQD